MKKFIIPILILVGMAAATSCLDDQYTVLDKGHDVLTLSASDSAMVLEERDHASDALELSWTTGTNFGTGNKIAYTLELAKAGTDFASPYYAVQDVTATYSWKKTVEELNSLVREVYQAEAGETVMLDARITAKVVGYEEEMEVQVDTVMNISIEVYEPVTSTLYLIGSAAPNGWSADAATEMNKTDNGIFTWTGQLKAGEVKMITTLGQFSPSYNSPEANLPIENASTLVYLPQQDDERDYKFIVDHNGIYVVDVNLLDMTISFEETEAILPAYENLYIMGDFNSYTFTQMANDPLDAFLFRIGLEFNAEGRFKFGTASGSWENNYKSLDDNAPITDTRMQLVAGYDNDNQWKLKAEEAGKAYKICVDIRTNQERMLMTEFVPYEMIYMIGDATPAGWSLDIAEPMVASADSPYIFTWTGNLNAGELKFTCDKKSDWNGAWFMADSEGKTPTGEVERMLFLDKSSDACKDQYLDTVISGIDYKWKVAEAGTYTITLNQLEETISIVKQ